MATFAIIVDHGIGGQRAHRHDPALGIDPLERRRAEEAERRAARFALARPGRRWRSSRRATACRRRRDSASPAAGRESARRWRRARGRPARPSGKAEDDAQQMRQRCGGSRNSPPRSSASDCSGPGVTPETKQKAIIAARTSVRIGLGRSRRKSHGGKPSRAGARPGTIGRGRPKRTAASGTERSRATVGDQRSGFAPPNSSSRPRSFAQSSGRPSLRRVRKRARRASDGLAAPARRRRRSPRRGRAVAGPVRRGPRRARPSAGRPSTRAHSRHSA